LKRLVVGGFEKVYELNRNFRNEGISSKHNPEFTMLEFYMAYADVNQMMDFAEKLLRSVAFVATGHTHVHYGEHEIDFSQPFERLTMKDAIAKYWPPELSSLGTERFDASWLEELPRLRALTNLLAHRLAENPSKQRIEELWEVYNDVATDAPNPKGESREAEIARLIVASFEYVAEERLIQPTFIYDFPKPISPLSKASPSDPSIAERFEYFVGGLESGNGFSELNDPEEQYQRFKDQVGQRERGDEEAMVMDEDYIRALSYGMPPAAGIGLGIDRLVMLLANKQSIRDVIMFPHMRPERRADDESSAGQ
jgi:lysyl-tRNA synthetase class 2